MEDHFQAGFASALLGLLFNKSFDAFFTELKKITCFEESVKNLETTFREAQNLLGEVNISQLPSDLMRALENQAAILTTLCYDAEDITDDLALNKTMKKNKLLQKLTKPHGVHNLKKKLEETLAELKTLLSLAPQQPNPSTMVGNRNHNEYLRNRVIGRANDIETIIQKLISCNGDKGVAIIGMCGLGKSALAEAIAVQFPCKTWITVPNGVLHSDFGITELKNAEDLINQVNVENKRHCSSSGNKCHQNWLIVLDNLLDVSTTDWDAFWSYIKSRNENQRLRYPKIIITTRNPKVTEQTNTSAHQLEYLSNECCENIIKDNARFHNEMLTTDDLEFQHRVELLAKKCEGLPLVAKVIGIYMGNCNRESWDIICKQDLWSWSVFEREILPKLLSCCTNMEPDARRCLAYISLFPSIYRFQARDLIYYWVGEGFIQPSTGRISLEQDDDLRLGDLIRRSILEFSDYDIHNHKERYKVHAFHQVIAQLAAFGICLQLEDSVSNNLQLNDNTRHLSLSSDRINSDIWFQIRKLKRLRTFLPLYDEGKTGLLGEIPITIFKEVACLRVLSLKRTNVTKLPSSIKELKHLRYLDISHTPVENLPKTLHTLWSLQIFMIKNTQKLLYLPENFNKLTNLRYLDWEKDDIRRLSRPPNVGELSSLQNLPLFIVGDKEGYSIVELKDMKFLQESICIEQLQNVKDTEQAMAARLEEKKYLTRIEMQWKSDISKEQTEKSKGILEALKPQELLEELKLINYGNEEFPQWIIQSILKKIHLEGCCSYKLFPALGKLKNLKTLVLQNIKSAVSFIYRDDSDADKDACFPLLEVLEFYDMDNLREWTELQACDMPHLRVLKFVNCPKMMMLPNLNIRPSLSLIIKESEKFKDRCQIGSEEWRKIERISKILIDEVEIRRSLMSFMSLLESLRNTMSRVRSVMVKIILR